MGGKEGEHEWFKSGMRRADEGINRKRRIWARAYANLLAYWGVVLGKLPLRRVITEGGDDRYSRRAMWLHTSHLKKAWLAQSFAFLLSDYTKSLQRLYRKSSNQKQRDSKTKTFAQMNKRSDKSLKMCTHLPQNRRNTKSAGAQCTTEIKHQTAET